MIKDSFKFTLALLMAGNSDRETGIPEQGDECHRDQARRHRHGRHQNQRLLLHALPELCPRTIPALVFRVGGSFSTALDRNDALHSQVAWGDIIVDLKQPYIDREDILDDLADNPYFVPYENNTWCHCEVVYQYDPRNQKHRETLEPIFIDVNIAAIENCMEPLFTSDPRVRKMLSPLAGNFSKYQQAISKGLDPEQVADNTLYSARGRLRLLQDQAGAGQAPERADRAAQVAIGEAVMIKDEAYDEFVAALGEENVSREPAVLDGYTWQPTNNDNPEGNWVIRPLAVVLPSSTGEVQEVVRTCNRHGLHFKAFSTGWGAWAGPAMENVVIVDLRRMNRIVELDARNMYAVVEPYVCGAQLQAEAMKVGLHTHIIGAGPNSSPLASATSAWGVGHDSIYMSYSARNLLGVEWVLPDGEVLRLGTLGSGGDWFNGDGPGPSLRGIMRGSCGALSGLGIFTRAALKLYNWPGPPEMKIDGIMLDSRMDVPERLSMILPSSFPTERASPIPCTICAKRRSVTTL